MKEKYFLMYRGQMVVFNTLKTYTYWESLELGIWGGDRGVELHVFSYQYRSLKNLGFN